MSKEYTWEDFEKCPIGTKVTFESGLVMTRISETSVYDCFYGLNKDTYCFRRNFEELKEFKDKIEALGKIIKIEEPTYTTVYEPKEVTMPEIEEMKRLTDELYKICDEVIKNYEDKGDRK